MVKTYILKGLDCPHCSAKIEKEVGNMACISSSAVNLMNQTLTVTVEDRAASSLLKKITKVVHSYEPEVEVSEKQSRNSSSDDEEKENKTLLLRLLTGAIIYAAAILLIIFYGIPLQMKLPLLIAAYIILGWDVLWQALVNITKGHIFDEHFLMSISTLGAFAIGEYPEAVAVMLFYQLGEFFQSLAVNHSRRSIADLMNICPDTAVVVRNGREITMASEDVSVGDCIIIKPGERIPLDGIIINGDSMIDTSSLTGESVPENVHTGDEALSGCINQSGVLTVRVTKSFSDSTASRIIDLVENASARKAPTENFITTFARYYTPVVVIMAVLLAVLPPVLLGGEWNEWLRRGFVFLIVSCPCALVISIPLAFFGGIGAASKKGILIKGSNYLEALNKVRTVVFDKTGTLTKGVFKVTAIFPENGYSNNEILKLAAQAESCSNHPIAKSILSEYNYSTDKSKLSGFTEIPGHGIRVTAGNNKILAGSSKLLEKEGIDHIPCPSVGTKVYIAVNGICAGCILISDEIKPDSKKTISALKKAGIEKTVMLTGDDSLIGKAVAEELGLDEYHAMLLPDRKIEMLEKIDAKKPQGSKLAFVGDGINDAPVLARADVGIAMGGLGSDAAIEAADVVLMTDELSGLSDVIEIARVTRHIVVQNIVFALGIKSVFLILGALGLAGMWQAVFGDVGVTIIAVLNSMRILYAFR